MKRMKKLFLCIVLSGCFILPSTASAIGPFTDPFGWAMRLLKNDADDERRALIAQYRRSKQEPDPVVTPSMMSDPFGLRRRPPRQPKWQAPRRGSPSGKVPDSTR